MGLSPEAKVLENLARLQALISAFKARPPAGRFAFFTEYMLPTMADLAGAHTAELDAAMAEKAREFVAQCGPVPADRRDMLFKIVARVTMRF